MKYAIFQCSRIGATHVRRSLPRQDRSYASEEGKFQIAVVADGHGSRRHFRSDIGAETACQVADGIIRNALKESGGIIFDDAFFSRIKSRISEEWQQRIRAHYEQNPLTDAEIEEQIKLLGDARLEKLMNGSDALIPYGSTLCAVFRDETGWGAVQIGDGCLTTVGRDGSFVWPMPKSSINEGNKTASLCMKDPMADFRHCFGQDQPAALLVYTDGIEKNFPSEGTEIVSLLNWVIRNEKSASDEKQSILEKNLDMLTSRSPIGDDLSIAGMVDLDADDIKPKVTSVQMLSELEKVDALILEATNTIRFNEKKLSSVNETDEAYEKLSGIISRKQKEIDELTNRREEILSDLKKAGYDTTGISELVIPEEEPSCEPEPFVPDYEQEAALDPFTGTEDRETVPVANAESEETPAVPAGKVQPPEPKTTETLIDKIKALYREDWRIALLPLDAVLLAILIIYLIKGI